MLKQNWRKGYPSAREVENHQNMTLLVFNI